MQTNSTELHAQSGNATSLTLQTELLARGEEGSGDVRVPMNTPDAGGGRAGPRRQRAASHRHSHSHGHAHTHSHHEPETDGADSDVDSGEPSGSVTELRYLFRWVHKSLPFLVILCAKLVLQHALGLAIGVGVFTTFLYVNRNIQNQVFLQERQSKLQCIWLLLLLTSSSLLLYYTFLEEQLYYCLIFLSPNIEPLSFWGVLWVVGVTNFILKFVFMGLKCLTLLVPTYIMTYSTKGRWYMLTEEVGQVYQAVAPVSVWFRYLVSYQDSDGLAGLTLGIVLALVYLIMKLLGLYGQWGSLQKTCRMFVSDQYCRVAATRSQCSEAGGVCPICQSEFRQPLVLLCQHIFCEECIALWLNQDKTCPLCRSVIVDKVCKWKDGATSPHLQIY
ncbi:E3 ubiquitin-protein ligase RNFT1 isoform X2 [Denticeps clupeoides]|nr:E3 ubiquitin-protein ligase RNFT1 isoform X2 [Denticeps clupeoides]